MGIPRGAGQFANKTENEVSVGAMWTPAGCEITEPAVADKVQHCEWDADSFWRIGKDAQSITLKILN